MRRRLRAGICRDADAGPGVASQQIWRQRLHARTTRQKRLRRLARLPEPALDVLFQRRRAHHHAPSGGRLVERVRPAAHRARLRFSSARAHGFALRNRPRHRRFASQHPGTNRPAPQLPAKKRTTSQRSADARLLRARPQHLPGDGANH